MSLDSPTARAVQHAARRRAGWLSLGVGVAVFAGKLAAWVLTGSTAVLSDALESVVNVVAAVLLVFSLRVAARPADRDHPYGHGKVEFFSAGIEGTLIFSAALLILVEAGRSLWLGPTVRSLDKGLLLIALFSALNGALGLHLVRTGRRTGSVALVADGSHVLTDVWTSAGVLVGLALVWVTGWVVLDPLVAILVALNVLRQGGKLMRESVRGLMDAAPLTVLEQLTRALEARREDAWIDVHGMRGWRSGNFLHVDFHLVVPRYFDVARTHGIHDVVERALRQAVGPMGDVIVHFDPCVPKLCASCAMPDCPVRGAAFEKRLAWSAARATRLEDPV
jgi:cation diffusion facilitator family transporter